MPCLSCCALQTIHGGEEAKETTKQEFLDNMFYIIKTWNARTNREPYWLSFDNNSIQATADLHEVQNPNDPHETVGLHPNGFKLNLPAYSHDLNRPIEHLFGTVKHLIKCELYANWGKYSNAKSLQTLVYTMFHSLPAHGLSNHVTEDVEGLPLLWQIISTPLGQQFADSRGRAHVGTGGDYPNAVAR